MKIAVVPEGREGIYLAERASLKAWIEAQEFEEIHNFGTTVPSIVIGADHPVDSVLADIDAAERVAILIGQQRKENLGHALALIMPPRGLLPERLEMYDLGEVTEADLELSHSGRAKGGES